MDVEPGMAVNGFTHVNIIHRPTGATFPHRSYTSSTDEAIRLARLTFPSALWDITPNLFDEIFEHAEPEMERTTPMLQQSDLF